MSLKHEAIANQARRVMTRELTKDEADILSISNWWQAMSLREAATLQLYQTHSCMPLRLFQTGLEMLFKRPVLTWELSRDNRLRLMKEAGLLCARLSE